MRISHPPALRLNLLALLEIFLTNFTRIETRAFRFSFQRGSGGGSGSGGGGGSGGGLACLFMETEVPGSILGIDIFKFSDTRHLPLTRSSISCLPVFPLVQLAEITAVRSFFPLLPLFSLPLCARGTK